MVHDANRTTMLPRLTSTKRPRSAYPVPARARSTRLALVTSGESYSFPMGSLRNLSGGLSDCSAEYMARRRGVSNWPVAPLARTGVSIATSDDTPLALRHALPRAHAAVLTATRSAGERASRELTASTSAGEHERLKDLKLILLAAAVAVWLERRELREPIKELVAQDQPGLRRL